MFIIFKVLWVLILIIMFIYPYGTRIEHLTALDFYRWCHVIWLARCFSTPPSGVQTKPRTNELIFVCNVQSYVFGEYESLFTWCLSCCCIACRWVDCGGVRATRRHGWHTNVVVWRANTAFPCLFWIVFDTQFEGSMSMDSKDPSATNNNNG